MFADALVVIVAVGVAALVIQGQGNGPVEDTGTAFDRPAGRVRSVGATAALEPPSVEPRVATLPPGARVYPPATDRRGPIRSQPSARGDIGVEDILRRGGDAATVVQSQRVRPEFTAFGQTVWSLDDQTRFAAHLPCLSMAEAEVVITQMSNSAQRWGIADGGVPVKGGWGPDEQGSYLVRQFGAIQTSAGQTAVSLAANPHDGSFDSGVAALNKLADWLDAHRAELPSGTCPAG